MLDSMATGTADHTATLQRVRVLCALTGEILHEPTHPSLGQVKLFVLKKWRWIHGQVSFPGAHTLFHLHFLRDQHSIDNFDCLGSLTTETTLDISCVFKHPQQPGVRAHKSLAKAIVYYRSQWLWGLLSKYNMPPLLRTRRGEMVNPLILLLQSPALGNEDSQECPRALVLLLEATCNPTALYTPQQSPSPLFYAIGMQNQAAVEDLLIASAEVNHTPVGREPPFCVTIRHLMGSITKTLLMYQADVELRGLAFVQSDAEEEIPLGPTPTELASDDRAMSSLLLTYQMPPRSPRLIEMGD